MPIYEFQCESCGDKKEILIVKESDLKGSHKLGCDKCKGMYSSKKKRKKNGKDKNRSS